MAQSRRGNGGRKPKKTTKLADRLQQWQSDALQREQSHIQKRQYQADVGRFKSKELENKFKGAEYVSQLNDVSTISKEQYTAATTYKLFEKEQTHVSKLGNVGQYERSQLDYMEKVKQDEFLRKKKAEQIESLLDAETRRIIGINPWDKSKIAGWMHRILQAATDLLDKYLKDGVYKYCINVVILKSTAIARQSHTLKSPNTDYALHLKVKNGHGLCVVIDLHAFKLDL